MSRQYSTISDNSRRRKSFLDRDRQEATLCDDKRQIFIYDSPAEKRQKQEDRRKSILRGAGELLSCWSISVFGDV